MADKRISQLIERTDIANNDVLPIVASGATTTNKVTISTIQNWMQDNLDVGVTSVGITLGSSGTDVNVTGSPVTTSGNITINIPDASASARGLVNTGTQTFAGAKTFNSDIIVNGVNVGRGGTNVPSNTRVGNSALQDNTTGANNTAVGFGSLIFTTTGSSNTAIGHQVLSNANGSVNTAVGVSSLFNLSTGDNNLGLGNQAGTQISGGANHTNSNNSIFIGSDTKPAANNQTNQIVIGHQAVGQGSNTVTIGNSSITSNKFFGRVIHADAVNADESATLGQVNTSLGGYVTLNTAQTITGSKTFNSRIIGQDATLTGSGSPDTLEVTHTSGSGIAVDISKAGNGEGLRVAKTSGSGNAVTITGGLLSAEAGLFSGDLQSNTRVAASTGGQSIILTANSGGTTNRIETTGVLPMALVSGGNITLAAGGTTPQITLANSGALTLTGALNGTTASFSGNVTSTGGNFRLFNGYYITAKRADGVDINVLGFPAGSNNLTSVTPNDYNLQNTGGQNLFSVASTGAATFSSSVQGNRFFSVGSLNSTDGSFYIDHPSVQTWKIGITNSNTSTFSIGNDNGGAFANKIFNITNSGNVGIGTASPTYKLVVSNGGAQGIEFDTGTIIAGRNYLINYNRSTSAFVDLSIDANNIFFTGNGTERMRITSGGQVQIKQGANTHATDGLSIFNTSGNPWNIVNGGDNNLYLGYAGTSRGVFATTGVYTPLSDKNKKKDFEDSTIGLNAILGLKPTLYRMIDDESEGEKELGFIAQEVKESIPYAYVEIGEDEEKFIGLNYNPIVAALVKAIQEQQEQIKSLTEQVEALKSQING